MFRILFKRRSEHPGILRVQSTRHDVRQLRRPTSQCPRFVQRQDGNFFGTFQRLGIPDQNARPRALPRTDHDGRRRRQAQRARAGDDQHGNRIDQSFGEQAGIPPPAGKSQ